MSLAGDYANQRAVIRKAAEVAVYMARWAEFWGSRRAAELLQEAQQTATTTPLDILAACQQIQDRELAR